MSMAVKNTLAETSIIEMTKKWLIQNGVNFDFNNNSKDGTQTSVTVKSRDTLIVENLVYETSEKELEVLFGKHGEIAQLLLPSTKIVCIVQYFNAKDALKAYRHLSYSKYRGVPLYLQWAPLNIFVSSVPRKRAKKNNKDKTTNDDSSNVKNNSKGKAESKRVVYNVNRGSSDNMGRETRKRKYPSGLTKIIVKNVAFEANNKELYGLFSTFGKIKSLRLPKKAWDGHRGFAFIEFESNSEAQNAFDALADSHFYGRHLVLQWAHTDNSDNSNTRQRS